MTRMSQLTPKFVEYIPEQLVGGTLYISKRYSTAAHLCCCGCGSEVVTPLNPAKWRISEQDDAVSLHPSIGNWSLPCQSHYWIRSNRVCWAGAMSPATIAAVKARDKRAVIEQEPERDGLLVALKRQLLSVWAAISKIWRG